MTFQNIIWIFSLWVAGFGLTIISLPLSAFLFGPINRIYTYTAIRFFSWIAVGYILLTASVFKIISLGTKGVLTVLILWAALNLAIFWQKWGGRFSNFQKANKKLWSKPVIQIFLLEFVGFFLMLGWAWIKSHNPEIYQIERFMDFGFIKALFNAQYLPLYDIWMAGKTLNYYYFGHLIAYLMLKTSAIPPLPGFFIIDAWAFSALALLAFGIGYRLFLLLAQEKLSRKVVIKKAFWAGLISAFSTVFAGTWHTTVWFLQFLYAKIAGFTPPNFWYPDPTRAIPYTITEMPIYTFMVAELHAHMWGLLVGAVLISALINIWEQGTELAAVGIYSKNHTYLQKNKKSQRSQENKESPKKPTFSFFLLLSWLLAISYMTNAWDAVTLGALSFAVFAAFLWVKGKKISLLYLPALPAAALILSLPWSGFIKSPLRGMGRVPQPSPIDQWILFWGALMVPVFLLFYIMYKFRKKKDSHFQSAYRYGFFSIIILLAFVFLIFEEVFYFKDILAGGKYYRANTVFKITSQVWLWLGSISGAVWIWAWSVSKNARARMVICVLLAVVVQSQLIYPIAAVRQAYFVNRRSQPLESGLLWMKQRYPFDYAAYEFLENLRQRLPRGNRVKKIVEAEGDSYTDVSRFSVFLGWPVVVGWPVHEWGWRGSYSEVGKRRAEIRQIYTSPDIEESKKILKEYNIDYIVVGEVEKERYKDQLSEDKLLLLGRKIFDNGTTMIVEVGEENQRMEN